MDSEKTEYELDLLKKAGQNIILGVGEDSTRPGLEKTPERFAKVIKELTTGYKCDASWYLFLP